MCLRSQRLDQIGRCRCSCQGCSAERRAPAEGDQVGRGRHQAAGASQTSGEGKPALAPRKSQAQA